MEDRTDAFMPDLDDVRWLVGPEGAAWMRRAADDQRSAVAVASLLRKNLSASRTHLVLEQIDLRRRARAKFASADRLFFTRTALEQATDEVVAAQKAKRFPAGSAADLCCGIGGDLLALVAGRHAVGVERDPVVALLAQTNLEAVATSGRAGTIVAGDAAAFPVGDVAAWHVDPDRRPAGRRTTQVQLHQPDAAALDRLLAQNPHAGLKLAPAAEVPAAWRAAAELEWMGRDRQCRQLVAWFGDLARRPGRRCATVLGGRPGDAGSSARTVEEVADARPAVTRTVGRYVLDPDPAVLAADLVASLAVEHELAILGPRGAYLTGDGPRTDPALACFEVTDVLPLDLKRLQQLVRDRGIGTLEIKKRGVELDPDRFRKRLPLDGENAAVLIVFPLGSSVTAVLARRQARPSTP